MSRNPARLLTKEAQKKPRKFGRRHQRLPEVLLRQELENEISESAEETDAPSSPPVKKSLEEVFQTKGKARKRIQKEPQRKQSYESETRRPIVCLAFVLPLLGFYEIGCSLLAGETIRSGIDQWMHVGLAQFGLGELVVLPLLTIGIFIVWHHRNDDNWQMRPSVLLGMAIEACCLGLILFWAAKAISSTSVNPVADSENVVSSWQMAVSYVGSGIYEELLFRIVLLLPVIAWANSLINHKKASTVIAVIAVSLFFAAAHYSVFNPGGSQFEITSFMFRFAASVIFCVLFLFRGFGIAVGTHVAYDLLTQI